ncbi:MAG: short chain dehydrogenase, partial [Propionicimonas sp.]
FGVELGRRSAAAGWGLTSTVSHPGVAPTSLLAARPEIGRDADTNGVRLIRWLSARGILVGTPQSAAEPALLAATAPAAGEGDLYGPGWPGHLGGPAVRQPAWASLRSAGDAARLWSLSERLTGVTFG